MKNNYLLGLDLGTGSLGWAVTDAYYEIQKKHGKALWGVRLFENANTAEERRIFRTSRRRLARKNWRIQLLQELFSNEMESVDDGFYLRMKESRYMPEDKRDRDGICPELPYTLFSDGNFTDKDYHRQFPTIYHLRKWLMETSETPDIRLVYLALHHMMKHRGHFLFSGTMESIKEFKWTFKTFIQAVIDEELDFDLSIENDTLGQVEIIVKDKGLSKTGKKTTLIKQLQAQTICEKAILNLLVGGTVKLSDIFGNTDLDGSEKPKISFSDNNYEEYAPMIASALGEQYTIIQHAKAVYDWAIFVDILGEHQSISAAKIAVYEKHKKDLAYLKNYIKNNMNKQVYQDVFVKTDPKLANYAAYIGMSKHNGKKQELADKRCSKEDFYKFLDKVVIKPAPEQEALDYLKREIEKGSFLPKQVVKENGVIPYQVHLFELQQIIENLKERVPVLKKYENEICKTFTFRIPYYVGPLNGIEKGDDRTNWAKRKLPGKIYPWNFTEIIDEGESAERFIRRMTNKCTYLDEEDVIPKNSILYSKFMVLNELNNLRINGEQISVELKQKIYLELFQRFRKITQKRLKDFLIREGITDKTVDITGIDGDFKGSLTAYHDFKEKLTDSNLSQADKENIILNITLFSEDKNILSIRLEKLFPQLTERQRKSLCTCSYKGWGRLSKAFLEETTAPAPETGEVWSIIQALWETNDNLMQVLSEKYKFAEAIEEKNQKEESGEISYQLIESLNLSPAVKRQIWQTLQVVKEVCKVAGGPPDRIFIEMAREKQESKRTDTRKRKLTELYKKCKSEEKDWLEELSQTENHKLRRDKLYLYYTQKGRCMYSGEVIHLEDLWDDQKYDIDHIYPQSKVMDDSLDNRVLVKREYNANKKDIYPIEINIRNQMHSFWKSLLDGDFISKEKYNRLVRGYEFEPAELAGFIARQIVETRQGTKAVASILKQVLPDTEIVYVKARIVSEFRHDFELEKVRELNDFHHAKDAYLNIVVGNTYYTKFTQNASWFIKENPGRSYNLEMMFKSKNVERNGRIAWKAGEDGTICIVKKTMNKNNILVTRRSYQVKGSLFDQQLMKKGKGQVPIKGSDERLHNIEKYGGYNKAAGTYFMLVESEDKNGKRIRTIEFVPLYLCHQIEKSKEEAIQYLEEMRQLKNPNILLSRIKIDTLFEMDGFYMWLSGRTGSRLIFKGANQLLLSKEDISTLKKIVKFVQRRKEVKNLQIVEYDKISQEELQRLYDVFLHKLENTVYQVRLGAQAKTLESKRDIFLQLCKEEKCIVLFEILHMFQCQSVAADLKLIDGPGSAGILVLNNNITNCDQISIVNQSITGIYEQKIDLKKI